MDTFHLLTSGIKFNKRRGGAGSDRSVASGQQPTQPSPAATSVKRKQKKKKNPAQASTITDDAPDINVFGRAAVPQSQQQASDSDSELELGTDDLEELAALGAGHQGHQQGDGDNADTTADDSEGDRTTDSEGNTQHHDSTGTQCPSNTVFRRDRQQTKKHSSADGLDVDPGCPVVPTNDVLEAANVVRHHYRIKVAGTSAPAPLRSWRELAARLAAVAAGVAIEDAGAQVAQHASNSGAALVAKLVETGWAIPTPIQRQAVPCLLEGRELLAVAPTGSGKTLAFLVPLLLRCKAIARQEGKVGGPEGARGPRALVISPTHELAAQQARVLRLLLPGSGLRGQLLTKATAIGNDLHKVDVVLANPLRLATLANEKKVELSQVQFLVLDEADRLFDMGFVKQIDDILAACTHPNITRALFSATLPAKVEDLARSLLRDPLRVTVGVRGASAASVAQRLLFVGREGGKLLALRQLLKGAVRPPVLVFTATKERARALHRELLYDGVRVDSIHAAQISTQRTAAVDNFRSGRTWVLIATDLIGRGMDFVGVNTVVNYDFPSSTEDYVHRVGRTGRAGLQGEAVTFFTEDDAPRLRPVAHIIKEAGGQVPEWMLAMKKTRPKERRTPKLPDAVARGDTISTSPGHLKRGRSGVKPGPGSRPQQGKAKKAKTASAAAPLSAE